MFCTKCGLALPAGGACANCATNDAVPDTRDSFSWPSIILAVLVSLVNSLNRGLFGDVNLAATLGAIIGHLGIPALISYFLFGRKHRRKAFSYGVLGFVVLLALGKQQTNPQNTEKRVGQLIKESAGLSTIESSSPEEAAVRRIYSEFLKQGKSIQVEQEKLSAEINDLYSPESYRDKVKMRKIIEALRLLQGLSIRTKKYFETEGLEIARNEINNLSISEAKRSEMFSSFEKGYRKEIALQLLFRSAELKSLQSDSALYIFALENQKYIIVKDGEILVSNTVIRENFNSLQSQALSDNKLQRDMYSRIVKQNNANLEQLGISSKDIERVRQ